MQNISTWWLQHLQQESCKQTSLRPLSLSLFSLIVQKHDPMHQLKTKNSEQHQELLENLRPDSFSDSYSMWFMSPLAALENKGNRD